MTGILSILALGFFLGMRHATDPDHVIAVSTIVSRHRTAGSAALIGALWGVGHTLTILFVGGGIILFRWSISPRVGLSMEFAVGLMLILLGVLNLTGVLGRITENLTPVDDHHSPNPASKPPHAHAHAHGDYVHSHGHEHSPETHPHQAEQTPVAWLDRHFGLLGLYQVIRPLAIGIVHGLAGSAAVVLLVLATISDPIWSLFYLLIFGVGTVVGMMLITAAISMPLAYTSRHAARLNVGLRVASGAISLGFGLIIAYQVGVTHGLFGPAPEWVPR